MFILFAAAAGAGIVPAGLFRLADGLLFLAAVRTAGSAGDFRLLFAFDFFVGAKLYGKNAGDCALLNGGGHFVKHIEAFHTECDNRVLLTVGTQVNAALEFFHRVDVVHPAQVYVLQKNLALELFHNRFAVFFFLRFVFLFSTL